MIQPEIAGDSQRQQEIARNSLRQPGISQDSQRQPEITRCYLINTCQKIAPSRSCCTSHNFFYSLCSVSLLFSQSFSTISHPFLRAFLLVFLYFLRALLTLSRLIKTSTTLSNLNLSHVISYLLFFTQRFFKENVRFIIYLFLGYVKVGMGSKKVESFYLREIVLVSELAR